MMFVFLPKEKFFVQRTGEPYACWIVDEHGELVRIEGSASLKDMTFTENDNFYTHWQNIVRYYTVGEEGPILVQEFEAKFPNHGFHRSDGSIG